MFHAASRWLSGAIVVFMSSIAALLLSTSCSTATDEGFYQIKKEAVTVVPSPQSTGKYVTLTAYSGFDKLESDAHSASSSFQLLRLDLKFSDDLTNDAFQTPLLVYDLTKRTADSIAGLDLLKGYPLHYDANKQTKVTFSVSAVKKNDVANFLEAFGAVKQIAAALPASAAFLQSPTAKALDAGATYLDRFSSTPGTTASQMATLNSTPQGNVAQVLILVPQTGSSEEVTARDNEVDRATYVVCGSPVQPKICTKDGGNVLDEKYPWILLMPTTSSRIYSSDFLWNKLPSDNDTAASCSTYTQLDVNSDSTAIAALGNYLDDEQRFSERILLASGQSLLDVKEAVKANEYDKAFSVMATELSDVPPGSGLFTEVIDGHSYAGAQTQMRRCMELAAPDKLGLFKAYASVVKLYSAKILSAPDDAVSFLRSVDAFSVALNNYAVAAPATVKLVSAYRALAEAAVWDSVYAKPVGDLSAATTTTTRKTAEGAVRLVMTGNGLSGAEKCVSCEARAQKALDEAAKQDTQAPDPAAAAIAAAAAAKSSAEGTLSLVQGAAMTNLTFQIDGKAKVDMVESATKELADHPNSAEVKNRQVDAVNDLRTWQSTAHEALKNIVKDVQAPH